MVASPKQPVDVAVNHVHTYVPAPPRLRLKIERGQRGGYGWEVSVEGEDLPTTLAQLARADAALKERFGVSGGE